MKALVCFLLAGAVFLFAAQPLISAQTAAPKIGYTATDLDVGQVTGHRVFRIDLDNPTQSVQMGLTNVSQELEGFYSTDNTSTMRSKLFGIAETPDGTGLGGPSVTVDLTNAAVSPTGLGQLVGETGINYGTEAGSARDHYTDLVYSVASDDRQSPPAPPGFPATKLFLLAGINTAIELNESPGLYLDGLAIAGSEVRPDGTTHGVIYASDCRLTDSLYRFNWLTETWDQVGAGFGVGNLAEDSGLGNWVGNITTTSPLLYETHLYMITEGENANVGRLWTVDSGTGLATLVGELRLAVDGSELPEDLEGFDIPRFPLEGQ
jgi:hypothetical protein